LSLSVLAGFGSFGPVEEGWSRYTMVQRKEAMALRSPRSGAGPHRTEAATKHQGPAADRGGAQSTHDHLAFLAQRVGSFVQADAALIVRYAYAELVIEVADPAAPWLATGTVLATHPSLGTETSGPIASLLSGGRRWCGCLPPHGFSYALLITGPALAFSGHLVLLANLAQGFSDLRARLGTAYLAQATQPAPLAVVDLRQVKAKQEPPDDAVQPSPVTALS
jgi:hypothetical protein